MSFKGLLYEFGFNLILIVYGLYLCIKINKNGAEKKIENFEKPYSKFILYLAFILQKVSLILV